MKNRFLFEVRPDLFPPWLTDTESELWAFFYRDLEARIKSGGR